MACFINCNFSHINFFFKSRLIECIHLQLQDAEEIKKNDDRTVYILLNWGILFGQAAGIYHNCAPINDVKCFLTGSIKNKTTKTQHYCLKDINLLYTQTKQTSSRKDGLSLRLQIQKTNCFICGW